MAPKNSAASKKAAKAGAKKASTSTSKPGIKKAAKKTSTKAPASSAKAKAALATKKTLKTPTLWTGKLKTSRESSKKTIAPAKKASSLKNVGAKLIKKSPAKKVNQMGIKGSAKKTLGGAAKAAAADGLASFDLEAFVKVKFSQLEKTAHQKKVNKMLLSRCSQCPPECVRTDQQHRGRAEQVQHEAGQRALQGEEGGQP